MVDRRDALAGAAEMVGAVEALGRSFGPPAVATVGRIDCHPNAVNVVTGRVEFSIDFRASSEEYLRRADVEIQLAIARIAKRRGLDATLNLTETLLPTPMEPDLCRSLQTASHRIGYTLPETVSGALHDAAILARHIPTAMLFVASKDGISHNPAEFSRTDDIALAAQILYAMVGGEDEVSLGDVI
jgi:allantoate deiminase